MKFFLRILNFFFAACTFIVGSGHAKSGYLPITPKYSKKYGTCGVFQTHYFWFTSCLHQLGKPYRRRESMEKQETRAK